VSERPAHPLLFVGSAPPRSAGAVFDAISTHVGDLVGAVPDGDQSGWIVRAYKRLANHPQIDVMGAVEFYRGGTLKLPLLKVKPGVGPADLQLGPYGFGRVAEESYGEFKRRQSEGRFAPGTRFQVCLPTPLLCLQIFEHPMTEFLQAAETALKEEVDDIVRAIPSEDLAIQWDVCEPVFEEVLRRPQDAPLLYAHRKKSDLPSLRVSLDSIARMAKAVPDGVSLGVHFCYGSAEDRHALEPVDTGLLVEFMNGVSERVARRIDWMHFPVPIERDDGAYFAPLGNLRLHPETRVYVGLLHKEDGVAGALRRITAAKRFVADFGVATECGLVQGCTLENYPAMLDLHREAAKLL